MVASAPPDLDPQSRQQLLRRVDASIQEMQAYIQKNLAQIELDQRNARFMRKSTIARNTKLEISEKLARMVDDYNKAIEERRFAQAEVIAKRAAEMDPDNLVVHQMVTSARCSAAKRTTWISRRKRKKGSTSARPKSIKASTPFNGDFEFGTTRSRMGAVDRTAASCCADGERHRSPGDLEIEQKLTTPVSLKFKQAPLGEVLGYLAKVTQVNMHIDPQGLKAEGVSTDEPVTIDLARDIQLQKRAGADPRSRCT